jgi:hypothetical protein
LGGRAWRLTRKLLRLISQKYKPLPSGGASVLPKGFLEEKYCTVENRPVNTLN